MKKIKFNIKILYFFLSFACGVSIWILVKEKPIPVESTKITRADFEERFKTDGIFKAKKITRIFARASGDLEEVDFKVGQHIKKNELITRLHWDFIENIKSPLDGVVAKIWRDSAGPIIRGEAILDIFDPESLQIEAEVLTSDALRMPPHAPVIITGLGDQPPLIGSIHSISRAGFKKVSALGIEEEKTLVYINIKPKKDNAFGDTFHAELDVLISRKENVLQVPLACLFKVGDSWAVYTIKNNRAKKKFISITEKNESMAILGSEKKEDDPVIENELVVLYPSDKIQENTLLEGFEKK